MRCPLPTCSKGYVPVANLAGDVTYEECPLCDGKGQVGLHVVECRKCGVQLMNMEMDDEPYGLCGGCAG